LQNKDAGKAAAAETAQPTAEATTSTDAAAPEATAPTE